MKVHVGSRHLRRENYVVLTEEFCIVSLIQIVLYRRFHCIAYLHMYTNQLMTYLTHNHIYIFEEALPAVLVGGQTPIYPTLNIIIVLVRYF